MKQLYIHIGAHKTGSTYIQKQFVAHEKLLLAKGILYPKSGRTYFGHHKLVESLIREDNETSNELLEELKQNHTVVVLSSENFEYLAQEQIEKIKNLFGGYQCKIIYFYRNWNHLLYSTWQENVKHGASNTFHEFLALHIGFPYGSKILNFCIPLNKYKNVFGEDNLVVCPYDILNEKTDLFEYIITLMNISISLEHNNEIVNSSLEPRIVECIRVLNKISTLKGIKPSIRVRQSLLENLHTDVFTKLRKSLFEIMSNNMVEVPDYGNCFAARSFFDKFFNDFDVCLALDSNECRAHANRTSKCNYIVSNDYLLVSKSRELIYKMWDKLEKSL